MKAGCKTNIKKKNVCTRAISLALLAAVFGASLSAGSLLCLPAPQVLDLQKQVNSGMKYLHTLGYKNAVIASGYCGAEHDLIEGTNEAAMGRERVEVIDVCKAIEEMMNESEERGECRMLVKQVRKGRITIEQAAEDANMSVEQFKNVMDDMPLQVV